MLLPNLIIAGAPKCGTTSLYNWLSDHPEVCPSVIKETRYFLDDGYPLPQRNGSFRDCGFSSYSKLFTLHHKVDHKIVFECTPDYLYQNTAIEQFGKIPSNPKIIFLLRRPSRRIYSLYLFAQNNVAILKKNITFQDFIAEVEDPFGAFQSQIILKHSIEQTHYITHLDKWLNKINKDSLGLFLFENMAKSSLCFMKNIALYLGIDPDFYNDYDFKRSNETYIVRNRGLHYIKRQAKNKLLKERNDYPFSKVLKYIYSKINVSDRRYTFSESDVLTLNYLDDLFYNSNNRLSEEFNLDLSLWYE